MTKPKIEFDIPGDLISFTPLELYKRGLRSASPAESLSLASTNLVQHGELPIAPEFSISASEDELFNVWRLGNTMFQSRECRWRYFAYTQIPPHTLAYYQISPEHTRAVYIPSNCEYVMPYSDVIFINPEIEKADGRRGNLEGCGSIGNGTQLMVVERPQSVHMIADIWSPTNGLSRRVRFVVEGWDAGGMQHEYDHLNGLTALSDPVASRLADLDNHDLQYHLMGDWKHYPVSGLRQIYGPHGYGILTRITDSGEIIDITKRD